MLQYLQLLHLLGMFHHSYIELLYYCYLYSIHKYNHLLLLLEVLQLLLSSVLHKFYFLYFQKLILNS